MPVSSVKTILGTQYFLHFGVMGAFLPFFNLYLHHLGFSGFEIGLVSAARSLTLIFFPLLWSFLADRLQMRRGIYLLCLTMSSLIWLFFLNAFDMLRVLVLSVIFGVFYAPLIAFLEAFTMDLLGHQKTAYGQVRLWGSLSFIGIVLVTGKLVENYSVGIVIDIILVGLALQTLLAMRIPVPALRPRPSLTSALTHFKRGRTIVFLLAATLMLASHGAYYGFFSIYLESLGYGPFFIGLTWVVASSAEIIVMLNSRRLFKNFQMESLLLFSFAMAALRWLLLWQMTSAVALLLLQCLHAFTYGMFHITSILYMDQVMSQDSKTVGQAVNNSLTYGVGLMTGFMLSGFFYARLPLPTLFAINALIALGAGAIFLISHWCWGSWRMSRPL